MHMATVLIIMLVHVIHACAQRTVYICNACGSIQVYKIRISRSVSGTYICLESFEYMRCVNGVKDKVNNI